MSNKYFKDTKTDANKHVFFINLNLTYQARLALKIIGILTTVFYTSGPISGIRAGTGDELSDEQAQNGVNFNFELKFDFEGQSEYPPPPPKKKKKKNR